MKSEQDNGGERRDAGRDAIEGHRSYLAGRYANEFLLVRFNAKGLQEDIESGAQNLRTAFSVWKTEKKKPFSSAENGRLHADVIDGLSLDDLGVSVDKARDKWGRELDNSKPSEKVHQYAESQVAIWDHIGNIVSRGMELEREEQETARAADEFLKNKRDGNLDKKAPNLPQIEGVDNSVEGKYLRAFIQRYFKKENLLEGISYQDQAVFMADEFDLFINDGLVALQKKVRSSTRIEEEQVLGDLKMKRLVRLINKIKDEARLKYEKEATQETTARYGKWTDVYRVAVLASKLRGED